MRRASGKKEGPLAHVRRWFDWLLWPLRKFAAKFALVEQERAQRINAISATADAVLERLEPQIHRLQNMGLRIQRENSAILRLLAPPHRDEQASPSLPARSPSAATPPEAITRRALFQEVERGSRPEVLSRFERYVDLFDGNGPVADLGCGRGEFLELAARSGIAAYGVDSDPDAVGTCRKLGLDARQEDLLAHLGRLPEACLGGVFCAQVVEHLPPEVLPRLVDEVARVLTSGGLALFETPNPASFATHLHSFWRDPTHVRPVPDIVLDFAARSAGLVVESILYSSLPPKEDRLQSLRIEMPSHEIAAIVDAFNAMAERLNAVLFGFQDYALLARKPG